MIASPRASLILSPGGSTELYASAGLGFHSNDARGATIIVDPVTRERVARVDPLVRSRGAEAGVRTSLVRGMRSTISLWALHLDSELPFVGDAGATEPSAASRRRGVTIANFYRFGESLSLDADLSFAHAALPTAAGGAQRIPGALESVLAAGATCSEAAGMFGAIRLRRFGAYPLVEDNGVRARASALVHGDIGYALRSGARVQLSVLNLLDADADDVQYSYASRLRGEPVGGVGDVHFHPAEPRQARVSFSWAF